jgi:HSP20 family protein
MNIIRWEPMRDVEEFFRQYSPFLAKTLARDNAGSADWAPVANISETDKEYLIKAELPEVKREDVKITLENGVITIAGERKQVKEEKDENVLRVESFYGTFSRSFSLPDNIEEKTIRAESKDGVLRVHIPKVAATKPKSVQIAVQ